MSDYHVTCVTKSMPRPDEHGHIIVVGTADGKYFAVSEVERKIRREGDAFYTLSASTGKRADVEPYVCPDCHLLTVRSTADGIQDNNLDNLNPCIVTRT
jgi:Protein of unknown function (DUF3892)